MIESITWHWNTYTQAAPGSDLWPITWGPDGNLYAGWGDGGGFGGTNSDGRVHLGFARLEGLPASFTGFNVWGGKDAENPQVDGQLENDNGKVYALLSVDGVLYGMDYRIRHNDVKIVQSTDLGVTWYYVDGLGTFPDENDFWLAAFLNFGQDYAGARDSYVYIYGGCDSCAGLHLVRVPKDQIVDKDAWEYFQGLNASNDPLWTSDFTHSQAVFEDRNGIDSASVIYNPGIGRYLLTVAHYPPGRSYGGAGRLGIFDAPEPWGPWTTVAYYGNWGGFGDREALGYHFPTKWISTDGKTLWMVFSSTRDLDAFNLVKATLSLKTDATPTAIATVAPTDTPTLTHTPTPPTNCCYVYLPLLAH